MSIETQFEEKPRGYWQLRPPEERVKNACIPKRYETARLDLMPEINEAVQLYRKRKMFTTRGVGMMFTGPSANAAGAALLTYYLGDPERKRMSGFYIDAQLLAKLFYAEIHNWAELDVVPDHDNEMLAKYLQNYDFLVIANFGTEPDTPFVRSAMTGLVGIRYDRMYPTFFCTDVLQKSDLLDRYNKTMERYFEMVEQVHAGG